jgi:hypothetical protein
LYPDAKRSAALVPPKNNASVLIYWAKADKASSATHVYANDKKLSKDLEPGTFYSYQAEPGPLRLASGERVGTIVGLSATMGLLCPPVAVASAVMMRPKADRLTLGIQPGANYYVKFTPAWNAKMTLTPPDVAERELADCHWLNPPKKN